tara:strand:- start:316 stop:738 length:423 start_codon:yes stop_codon:yes gene_type:complete
MKIRGDRMLEMVLIGLFGVLVGVGGTVGIQQATKNKDPVVVAVGGDQVAKAQVDVQKQLTDLDLVKEICAPSFIVDQQQTDLLCREMFCRMQQRGIDAQTSQGDCSEIANIANTKSIQNACKDSKGDDFDSCVDLFFKRK